MKRLLLTITLMFVATTVQAQQLDPNSLVGTWDCSGMIITLARSGRYELEYQPRGMGG